VHPRSLRALVVGARNAIVVELDWTDFDADKQATTMLSLITDHGRATPLPDAD
jgi:hypothetical protein